jgi:hypothetical protein
MEKLKKRYLSFDFSNLTEKNIIYMCRDCLDPKRNLKTDYESEILQIIQSKEWDWTVTDIDKCTILTYPIRNNAYSIVKYLLDNSKYDLKTYDIDTSHSLTACILLVGEKMTQNIIRYDIHPRYIDDMLNKAYLYASSMSKQDDCDKYLKIAKLLLERNVELNNINPSAFTGVISHIILNNNENKHQYLNKALHHLLEDYPLDIRKKEFHVKKFFDPVIWKSKKLPQDISSTLENWITYHSLNSELNTNNQVNRKLKI